MADTQGRRALPLIIIFPLVLVVSGAVSTLLFLRLLTPPLWDYFHERDRAGLELATHLALEICESGLDALLQLRLSDEPSMVETIRNDTLLRIEELDSDFSHMDILVINEKNELLRGAGLEGTAASMFAGLPRKSPERPQPPEGEPGALIHWRYFPFFRWHLVAYRSSADVQAPVLMARNVVASAMVCTILFLLGTFLLVYHHYIQRPLGRVIKAAGLVPQGILEPLPVLRNDELGRLTDGFNSMVEGLEEKQRQIDRHMAALTKSLHEKEILLQEVHHRVRNNLNIIISLLNLRSQTLTSAEDAVQAFIESKNRIRTMAMIHGQLFETKDFANVRMDRYIEGLIGDLRQAYLVGRDITIETGLDDVTLDVIRAVPLGLIVNEGLSNALRHAYAPDDTGTISLRLTKMGERTLELVIADDGRGMAGSPDEGHGLGMVLIKELTAQLGGTLEVRGGRGTEVRVRFPYESR